MHFGGNGSERAKEGRFLVTGVRKVMRPKCRVVGDWGGSKVAGRRRRVGNVPERGMGGSGGRF